VDGVPGGTDFDAWRGTVDVHVSGHADDGVVCVKDSEGKHGASLVEGEAAFDLGRHSICRRNRCEPEVVEVAVASNCGEGCGMGRVEGDEADVLATQGDRCERRHRLFGDRSPLEFGGDALRGFEGVVLAFEVLVGAFAEAAEAAFALLVVVDGLKEMDAAEVGPEAVSDKDLGVSDLPEEEVGDALLAGGADDEIRVRHVRGIEVGGELGFVDAGLDGVDLEEVFEGAAALVGLFDERGDEHARGVDDLRAGTVVEGKGQGGAGVLASLFLGPLHGFLDFLGKAGGAANICHAYIVVVHTLDVSDEVALEETHQETDLCLGSAKIVF